MKLFTTSIQPEDKRKKKINGTLQYPRCNKHVADFYQFKKKIIFFVIGLALRINRFISVDMWLLHFLWRIDYLDGYITILWFFLKLLF